MSNIALPASAIRLTLSSASLRGQAQRVAAPAEPDGDATLLFACDRVVLLSPVRLSFSYR